MSLRRSIVRVLTVEEKNVFDRLDMPQKIQDYLDTLPINFEVNGETYMSPRRMMCEKTAHCFEGVLFAAAVLAYHGKKPLLMDLRSLPHDEDHVVALFKQDGHWGAISKTNHAILRYRDPVYRTVRELAMSYFNEYLLDSGEKSMRAYSAPFDLSVYDPADWLTTEEDLFWLVDALDESRHFPVAPKKNLERLRNASHAEIRTLGVVDWKSQGKKAS